MSELKVDAISESTGNNAVRMGHAIVEKANAVSQSSNSLTVDASDGGLFTTTVTANISTFAINNLVAGQAISIIFTNNGTGGYTITTSIAVNGGSAAAIKTAGGAGWTMSTAANAIDIVTFIFKDAGTTVYIISQLAFG